MLVSCKLLLWVLLFQLIQHGYSVERFFANHQYLMPSASSKQCVRERPLLLQHDECVIDYPKYRWQFCICVSLAHLQHAAALRCRNAAVHELLKPTNQTHSVFSSGLWSILITAVHELTRHMAKLANLFLQVFLLLLITEHQFHLYAQTKIFVRRCKILQ